MNKKVSIRDVEKNNNSSNNYMLQYKEWGGVVKYKRKFNQKRNLINFVKMIEKNNCNYNIWIED